MRWLVATAGFVLVAAAAQQDVALKDLMPKGMVVGVAISQRQFEGTELNRGRANYPLLWDRGRRPKPAFDAVVQVLRGAK